jgi:hypothetical protein
MATQAVNTRVLRICILQDRDVVQERIIKAGESVRVGESEKNTFVFPKTNLPAAEFPMFINKAGKYQLCFTGGMKGKISSGGAIVGLDKLRTDPSISKQGEVWRYPLTEADRGKVVVDNVTVLFQFVQPPPVQAVTPIEGMDFRPLLFDDDDPALYGFIALFSALAVVFSVFIYFAPEPDPMSSQAIQERFAHIVDRIREQKEIEEPPPVETDDSLSAERDEKEEAKSEEQEKPKEAKKPKSKLEAAQERQKKMEAFKSKIKIAQIGTRGKSSGGTTSDAYEAGVLGQLDGLEGSGVALDNDPSLRTGSGGTQEDVSIGDMKADGAGSTSGGDAVGVDISDYSMKSSQGDLGDTESPENVEATVRKREGQLMYCYENQLRADPSLSGRIVIEWQISNDRVTSIQVASNETGNDELASCIVKKIKRWRFEGASGAVSWPFVFRKN